MTTLPLNCPKSVEEDSPLTNSLNSESEELNSKISGSKPGEECQQRKEEEEATKKPKRNTKNTDLPSEKEDPPRKKKKKNLLFPLILIWFPLTSPNSIHSTHKSLLELKDLTLMPFMPETLDSLIPKTKQI